jgi:hypothetical protein
VSLEFAILRAASLLVPRRDRPEWLAQWRGDLWHVNARRIVFSAGAFRDAVWMRRHAERRPLMESPAACLLVLAALLGVSLAVPPAVPHTLAVIEPVARRHATASDFRQLSEHLPAQLADVAYRRGRITGHLAFDPRGARVRFGDYIATPIVEPLPWTAGLAIMVFALLMVAAIHPVDLPRAPFRFWVFLIGKFAVLIPLVIFASFHIASWIAPAMHPQGLLIGFFAAFRWALADQRRRCPECLRLLAHPTRIGSTSQTFLEWYGTELACVRGHGLLYLPESPAVSYAAIRWLRLDASWAGLFSEIG